MLSPYLVWAIFLFASIGSLYLMVGYPLFLYLFPHRTKPVAKDSGHQPFISVLLAVYNGEEFIREKLDSLLAQNYPAGQWEILLLSDGSTDQTAAIGQEFTSRGVRVIELPRGGKAAALNAGLKAARGEILFFTDVRQKLDPDAMGSLAANFADPEVGAVTGELKILQPNGGANEQADLDLYWRYEIWVRGLHSAIDSLFNTTGCLYAMRASLARPLPAGCLGDDAVLPLNAYRAGFRIVFDPASQAYDYATAPGGEWKRRMRTLGGMWQVVRWHPGVFFIPRRMWLHFISHKLGRLILPWLLIAILTSTLLMPAGPVRTFLLYNEALLGFLAAMNPLLGPKAALKRFSSRAHTFILMNIASLLSVQALFRTPAATWTPTRTNRTR